MATDNDNVEKFPVWRSLDVMTKRLYQEVLDNPETGGIVLLVAYKDGSIARAWYMPDEWENALRLFACSKMTDQTLSSHMNEKFNIIEPPE